jgi:ABC-type Fe3+/spermidine/putrescine transport system ATPase subunit
MDGDLGQGGAGKRLIAPPRETMEPFLTLHQLRKSFAGEPILEDISVSVEEGEILVLLGPSGSGKTTLLRLIAGFETPDGGSIEVGGEQVSGLPPERRNFGMVFQHYALFPHMTVAQNVAFGLEKRTSSRREVEQRTTEMLELVDLAGFEPRRVQEISGGQQQRVALARALAPHPRIMLLDEPLSNLDPELRERTRRQLRQAIRRVGLTAVWVTHEQEEAFDVGDRVALLENGALAQVGTPEELYLRPSSRFVASFVGRASVMEGLLRGDGLIEIGDIRFRGQGVRWPAVAAEELEPGTPVEVVFRPESLQLCRLDSEDSLAGVVSERRFTGETTYYRVELELGGSLLVRGALEGAAAGDHVSVALHPSGPPPRCFHRPARENES